MITVLLASIPWALIVYAIIRGPKRHLLAPRHRG